MKAIQLAKNEMSFQLLNDWHDRFAAALKFEVDTKRIETSFGFVDVMIGPPDDGQFDDQAPLIILHGAMAGAPFALGELYDLPARRRIYAVNIPGQSTRAAQVRLDFRSDEYGRWLCEVMDGLGIGRAIICGVSWGGGVALQLAKASPDRISGMVLVVPASVVSGPVVKNVWRVALPILRYKLFPSEKNRDRALSGLLTSGDELWSPYLGDAIRHWNVDFSAPPILHPQDLKLLTAPVFVIAADHDLSFPGEKLIARSQALFPNLVGSHLLTNSCHSPSFLPADRQNFTRIFKGALELISSETKSTTKSTLKKDCSADQTVSEAGQ
ncbi:MAG TPA: alpha/beta hydrolase [Planctomycetaceae bacterium]|nr:alpha/beta hydrolase [Planctomycetaceae bacterium]